MVYDDNILNLGLINLFPIPMLDGGHLLLNFIEYLKGSPLNKKSLEIIHSIGLFLLTIFNGFCIHIMMYQELLGN